MKKNNLDLILIYNSIKTRKSSHIYSFKKNPINVTQIHKMSGSLIIALYERQNEIEKEISKLEHKLLYSSSTDFKKNKDSWLGKIHDLREKIPIYISKESDAFRDFKNFFEDKIEFLSKCNCCERHLCKPKSLDDKISDTMTFNRCYLCDSTFRNCHSSICRNTQCNKTFCSGCIKKYKESQYGNYYQCPFCRVIFDDSECYQSSRGFSRSLSSYYYYSQDQCLCGCRHHSRQIIRYWRKILKIISKEMISVSMCMDYMEKINKLFVDPVNDFEYGYYGDVIFYFFHRIIHRRTLRIYDNIDSKLRKIIRSYVFHHLDKTLSDHKTVEDRLIFQFENQVKISKSLIK